MTLGYRHGFHCGNAADVLKHSVLSQLMHSFSRVQRNWYYLDTHSGAGRYDLTHTFASKLARHRSGVGRLWGRTDYPDELSHYVQSLFACNNVSSFNALADGPKYYPGSPYIVSCMRRSAADRMQLHDLHSTDHRTLSNLFGSSRGVSVAQTDGFDAVSAANLPPAEGRGLVLIDPAYELVSDYARGMDAFERGLGLWSHGCYALWYPLISPGAGAGSAAANEKASALQSMQKRWYAQTIRHVTRAASANSTPGALFRIELATHNPPSPDAIPFGASTQPATLRSPLPRHAPAASADSGSGSTALRSDGTPGLYGSGLLIATPAQSATNSFFPAQRLLHKQFHTIAQYLWTILGARSPTAPATGGTATRFGYYLAERIPEREG